MLREVFKHYLRVSSRVSDRSVTHYVTAINTINTILTNNNYPITDLFSIKAVAELEAIKNYLGSNEEYIKRNTVGHNMYSVAFKHFCRFVCEDDQFFSTSIQEMDIPIDRPEAVQSSALTWNRNQIIKDQAIMGARYLCENNHDHKTFTSRLTGHPYMEGHHLIPIHFQPEFNKSLDVYSNVVCLCPICHRLLHYGADKERQYVAESFFETRHERLQQCGIDLSKREFLKMVI